MISPIPKEGETGSNILITPVPKIFLPQFVAYSGGNDQPINAPDLLVGFPGTFEVKRKTPKQGGAGLRERWKDKKGRYYEWDSMHGEIEKYNKIGDHLGSYSHLTGEQKKGPIKSRNIKKFL